VGGGWRRWAEVGGNGRRGERKSGRKREKETYLVYIY